MTIVNFRLYSICCASQLQFVRQPLLKLMSSCKYGNVEFRKLQCRHVVITWTQTRFGGVLFSFSLSLCASVYHESVNQCYFQLVKISPIHVTVNTAIDTCAEAYACDHYKLLILLAHSITEYG